MVFCLLYLLALAVLVAVKLAAGTARPRRIVVATTAPKSETRYAQSWRTADASAWVWGAAPLPDAYAPPRVSLDFVQVDLSRLPAGGLDDWGLAAFGVEGDLAVFGAVSREAEEWEALASRPAPGWTSEVRRPIEDVVGWRDLIQPMAAFDSSASGWFV